MRRRQVRTIREEERPTLLLMAAGAVAGAAAGLYLGRRYRSMDAFLEDVRDRFGALRDIWYSDELSTSRRARLGIDVMDDDVDDEEDDDVDEELDEIDEEEYEESPYATSEAYEEDEEEFDDDDDEDADEFEDDYEDEIEAVVRDNGVSEAERRAEDVARRLEERVLEELHDEPVLGTRSIEIAVVGDGVVELTGTVHAIDEISRAAAVVRGVPGVSMVLNRIEVRTGGSIDTASVAREQTPPSE
jgi:hypothetical protein